MESVILNITKYFKPYLPPSRKLQTLSSRLETN